jgi:hypothetical protein
LDGCSAARIIGRGATVLPSTHLISKQLLVYTNADDLRAFLMDGSELGVLDA